MSLLEQFMGRDSGPAVQFVKYAIGGALATAVHVAAFHVLAWKVFPALQPKDWAVKLLRLPVADEDDATRARHSMYDNGIAFVISNFVAYTVNILWVFHPGRHAWWVEIALFYLVSGASMLLGTLVMGWLIRRRGIRTTYAFGANLVTALLINYALRKFFIFRG